jgi:hypothetical protein
MVGNRLVLITIFIAVAFSACASPQGDPGERGPEGEAGPPGAPISEGSLAAAINLVISERLADLQGAKGSSGPEGPQGPAPSEEALAAAINLIISSRLADLQGPKGDQGPDGPQGGIGPEGPTGAQGPQGEPFVVMSSPGTNTGIGISVGTWLVGQDIQAGRYWTDGPSGGSSSCYWARLSGFGGHFSEIIANGNVRGPGYVDLSPSDVGFETKCTWIFVN